MAVTQLTYSTISEAVKLLEKEGFTIEFSIRENRIADGDELHYAEDFELIKIFRYEGDTDPGDESIIYAIENPSGKKGWLIEAYGAYADSDAATVISKFR